MRGEGNCTYAAKSACVNGVIGRYFESGDITSPGKICEVDQIPFEN